MKETTVGTLLLVFGFSGILFISSSIFFGFLATGIFLVIYGSVVSNVREPEHTISPILKLKNNITLSYCHNCDMQLDLDETTKYCSNCGEKIKFVLKLKENGVGY